jgi:hypothetical protein
LASLKAELDPDLLNQDSVRIGPKIERPQGKVLISNHKNLNPYFGPFFEIFNNTDNLWIPNIWCLIHKAHLRF